MTRFGPSTCRRARTTVMAMAVVTSVNAFANPRGPMLRHQAVFQEIVEVREHAACRCLAKSANLSRFNVSMYFNTFFNTIINAFSNEIRHRSCNFNEFYDLKFDLMADPDPRYGADCSLRKCPGTVCYSDSSTKDVLMLKPCLFLICLIHSFSRGSLALHESTKL